MRLGLITGEFPPMEGGVGAFTERLAQAMAELGHEIHVMTQRLARPAAEGTKASWRDWRKPLHTEWGYLHPIVRRWNWGAVGQLAQIALRYELDLLNIQYQAAAYHMRNPAINLAPWRLRGVAPVVTTFHDLRVPYLFPRAGALREAVVRLTAQKSNGVIVTNEEDHLVLRGWLGDQANIAEIPIGSNIRFHEAGPDELTRVRQRIGLKGSHFLLGYFGFLNPSKGADLLVGALGRLPEEVQLIFLGGQAGSSDQQINQAFAQSVAGDARRLGVDHRVRWSGFLPDRELSIMLQACDLLVMPYRDGVSLRRGTLMAALAHGRAIISTAPAHPVEQLKHGDNIWLAPAADAEALAQAIDQLRSQAELREKLAHGASKLAGQFGWEAIAQRSLRIFEGLIFEGLREQ